MGRCWLWAVAAVAALLGVLTAVWDPPAGASSPSVTEAPGDAGDSISSAFEVPLDVPVEGVIDSATDVDVFELTVPERREVLIYTTGDLDTAGALLDHTGAELDSFDAAYFLTTENNFLLWDTLRAGTYYVSVSATDGATGSYTLHTESSVNTTGFADAAPIALDSSVNALIDGGAHATDYYRLDIDTETDVLIYTTTAAENTIGRCTTAASSCSPRTTTATCTTVVCL